MNKPAHDVLPRTTFEQPIQRFSKLTRRDWLCAAAGTACGGLLATTGSQAYRLTAAEPRRPTTFQLACMTLPYSAFPLARALEGIKSAGFQYVAWGTTHREGADQPQVPVLAADAPADKARTLGQQCRDLGLEPVMMFSMVYPEAHDGLKVLRQRLQQASAAGIGQVLTFGHTDGGNRAVWIDRFKQLGPIARDLNVTLVVKQHGGTTGTGKACAEIIRAVDDPGVMVNYDAGNVMDYLDLNPIPDIQSCRDVVRSFCLKDHRNWPADQDCGPGYGEIDHYRLLDPVCWTGQVMPLCFENIFPPLLPRPTVPETIDSYARLAREYLEAVVAGLQTTKR
jgi:sugar phosphate isomerase/epimerase